MIQFGTSWAIATIQCSNRLIITSLAYKRVFITNSEGFDQICKKGYIFHTHPIYHKLFVKRDLLYTSNSMNLEDHGTYSKFMELDVWRKSAPFH